MEVDASALGDETNRISSGTGRTGASRSVCEAQVALIHLGGHEIGHIILIQRIQLLMPCFWKHENKPWWQPLCELLFSGHH